MKRPQGNIQASTGLGITGLLNHVVFVFNEVKIDEFWKTVSSWTIDEIVVAIAPFVLFLWAIFHDEEKRDVVKKELNQQMNGIVEETKQITKQVKTQAQKDLKQWVQDVIKRDRKRRANNTTTKDVLK